MPRTSYIDKSFPAHQRQMIAHVNRICGEYAAAGYDMTLRQVYYQFVAHDLFPDNRTWRQTDTGKWVRDPEGTKNAEPNYKWLGEIINDARLGGLVDWRYIVDRTRNIRGGSGSDTDPSQLIQYAAQGYSIDKWEPQPYHVEVWIEKEALVGVLQRACLPLEVSYFSCRGYTSQSEAWAAAQRLGDKIAAGKKVRIIHLGDHDPSGIDMTRDIDDRLTMFIAQDRFGAYEWDGSEDEMDLYRDDVGDHFEIRRIALNMGQVRRYNPPPNPAKVSDSRAGSYVRRYGASSWELDALDPPVLVDLIETAVLEYRDEYLWQESVDREEDESKILQATWAHWDEVASWLREQYPDETGSNGANDE